MAALYKEPHTIVLNPVGLFGDRFSRAEEMPHEEMPRPFVYSTLDPKKIVFSGRGVNNSGILSGSEQHVIVVTRKDADEVRKYTDALGTTSLYSALEILSTPDTSSMDKAKAIEDLILIRLILSGSIQFKEESLLGLFQSVVGNKFKKLPESSNGGIDDKGPLVERLLRDLDEGKKDVTVIKPFIIMIILNFGLGAIPTFGFLQFSGSLMGRADDIYLSNLNFMYPIIIGILASMAAARGMVNYENNIYTIALVKLIDRFLSSNMILDIINDRASNFGLPTPLRGNQLGMALYFQYIKQLQPEPLRIIKFNKFIGDDRSGNSPRGGRRRRTRRYKRRSTRKA